LACHPKLRRSNMEIVPLRQGFGGTTFALTELAAAGICTMREDWPANRSSAGATWKSSPYAKASGGQPSLLLNWQPPVFALCEKIGLPAEAPQEQHGNRPPTPRLRGDNLRSY